MVVQSLKRMIREWFVRRRFPQSRIYSGAIVDEKSQLNVHSVIFPNVVLIDSSLGMCSYVQAHSVMCNTQIGPFCSIAGNVHIGLAMHPINMVSTNPVFYDNTQPLPYFFTKSKQFYEATPKTIIEADVWIGQGAMIKAGVKVGIGAVIGAGAIVTRDVSPYSVVVGVPAREVKKRFDDSTCKKLIDSKWWKFDDAKLEKIAPFFSDPQKFIEVLEHESYDFI